MKFRIENNSTAKHLALPERRAEVTPEEHIQAQEIKATHSRASRKRHALRFVATAIGELEFFQDQVLCHQLPSMEEICQYCQAAKWKDKTANSCCRSGKVVLAPSHDLPQRIQTVM
jgi:hypothetical protein